MIIATHNGNFHADDVMGVSMLKMVMDAEIIRTRDVNLIFGADYAVDVGGVYDAQLGKFDHHQTGGAGFRSSGVPYASSGLVWKTFGQQIVEKLTGDAAHAADVADRVDQSLISPIDAIDCGIEGIYKGAASVSAIIEAMNPDWRDGRMDFDGKFSKACDIADMVLRNFIRKCHASFSARQLVENAVVHSSGRIIHLEKAGPWKSLIDEIHPDCVYVIFQDPTGSWRVQGVPVDPAKFATKLPLPKTWAGKEGEELSKITGVEGCIFCHNGRFIAGNKTQEGAMLMAEIALKSGKPIR